MTTPKAIAPLSSKGANQAPVATPAGKVVSVNLDWLRYTAPWRPEWEQGDNLRVAIPRHPEFSLTGELIANAKGYDHAMRLSHGVVHWHSKLTSQGIGVELSGSDLGAVRGAGVTDLYLLQHIADINANVSTMDSAVDVYNHSANHRDVMLLFEAGSLETTARDVNEYGANKMRKGEWNNEGTIYVGSPKSPRQIRIYNKAAEVGRPKDDWVRIEMRWRGKHARSAHHAMLEFGIAEVTRKAIKTMLNPDIEWFQEALGEPVAQIEPVRRPETDTRAWLIKLVAPLLERELMNERRLQGQDLYMTFDKILKEEAAARRRVQSKLSKSMQS